MSQVDRPVAPDAGPNTFEAVAGRRFGRRRFLAGGAAVGLAAVLPVSVAEAALGAVAGADGRRRPGGGTSPATPAALTFLGIAPDRTDEVTVPPGYRADVLVAWGDPLFHGDGPFRIDRLTAAEQARRFGFNSDFVQFLPLPGWGASGGDRALLWNNHEYTDASMMFPDLDPATYPTAEQAAIELAAHGASVVEIQRLGNGRWKARPGSRFNRRITATTPMRISGPAAGDPRVGDRVEGMLNNCGGGLTPWGTVLTAEENFQQYFANNDAVTDPAVQAAHRRYGVNGGASDRGWERHHARFDLAQTPNEPFKFGWVVEVDPYDPRSTPVKRTALGRIKHEAATTRVAADGRVAVYSGDDERFECLYKFVTAKKMSRDRRANRDLLDEGTLYAARFDDDGTGTWLPLVFGPELAAAGFTGQADVLIRLRDAAAALGATKMDRPEDVEASPTTGKVYMACTNNTRRGTAGNLPVDAANPRAVNRNGHVIEITEGGDDAAATSFTWEILILCGDPADPSTYYAGFDKTKVSPIACPDNLSFDSSGNLWIATDGAPSAWSGVFDPAPNDAIHAVPVEGADRGAAKQFLSGVVDCEVASLLVADDDRVLFASIQHPGEGSSLAAPSSTWPGGTPRPAVVAVTKRGRRIGS
ncbi:MAG: PhoX family phosphatase [Actinobacteria bacterium]|nr:PhoX family phosphatase [Actinomycetota bacterium]